MHNCTKQGCKEPFYPDSVRGLCKKHHDALMESQKREYEAYIRALDGKEAE